jgi:hypothetical protein
MQHHEQSSAASPALKHSTAKATSEGLRRRRRDLRICGDCLHTGDVALDQRSEQGYSCYGMGNCGNCVDCA